MPTSVPITLTPLNASLGPSPRAADRPMRQIAVLVIAAFAIGFVGFVALGRPLAVVSAAAEPPTPNVIVQPADESLAVSPASDDWNLPKRI